MSDPDRLRDLCDSSFERALLDAGVAYRSSDNAREKTLAALGLAGTAVVSATAVTVASTSLVEKLGWTKLLAISGLSAAAVVPAGYYALEHLGPEPTPLVAAPVPAPVKAAAPVAAAPAARSEQEPESVTADELPQLEEAASAPAPRPDARGPAAAVSQSALAAELAALDRARSRLDSGDAAGALALLADYSRSFPRGRLALEAEVMRIDALAKSGDGAAAKKRAEAFLRRHPNSVLASRVRGYLPE